MLDPSPTLLLHMDPFVRRPTCILHVRFKFDASRSCNSAESGTLSPRIDNGRYMAHSTDTLLLNRRLSYPGRGASLLAFSSEQREVTQHPAYNRTTKNSLERALHVLNISQPDPTPKSPFSSHFPPPSRQMVASPTTSPHTASPPHPTPPD
jgi:hypothetical protein